MTDCPRPWRKDSVFRQQMIFSFLRLPLSLVNRAFIVAPAMVVQL